ncbi:steryl deacetylase ASCRUDRAFT_74353 [Ascoidea rubescens DSM 1968]|uniref:Alpha/beta-hydrolase n=1 Tax=Ascoidea rubescens DSM 1968 TaxID=1344418 RepID=A0A1D2VMQ7_9ASCO|nr:hypothetical protein ASCRUDRAFT_74353 [Ascoidea rubescens DSM 1968]ODV62896.1 hypothetical protein ASCRUDRAFT_74353 [Ascoidea rubescens DSM 1968]
MVNFFYKSRKLNVKNSSYLKNTNLFEFIVIKILKHQLKNFKPNGIGGVILNDFKLFKFFHKYRNYGTSLHLNLLGIIKIDKIKNINGLKGFNGFWIHNPDKTYAHDLILFYIHGGGFNSNPSYLYIEFLNSLLESLFLKGFKNPAVFIPSFVKRKNSIIIDQQYPQQLNRLSKIWNYINEINPNSNIVLMGDSTGGTLALSLLLHITKPNKLIENSTQLKKPLAMLLISPVTNIFYHNSKLQYEYNLEHDLSNDEFSSEDDNNNILSEVLDNCPDFITEKTIANWSESYLSDYSNKLDPYLNPGMCESIDVWSKAIPSIGISIIYGEEEYLSNDIAQFTKILKSAGKVKVDAISREIHNWPILNYYVSKDNKKKSKGIELISERLTNMILWQTPSHFEDY